MEWLITLGKTFSDFIPRPVLVTPDQKIVVFFLGRWALVGGAFWYPIWPIFWTCEVVQISEQLIESQVVIKGIKTRWQATYVITDPLKSVTVATDVEEIIEAVINSHLVENELEFSESMLNDSLKLYGASLIDLSKTSTGIPTIDING